VGLILNAADGDFNAIRALLGGIDPNFLTDPMLDSIAYVGMAELVIISKVNSQAQNGVRSVAQILALPPTDLDFIALKNACIYYTGYLTGPGMTNLVNTSISMGEQTVDLGGLGAQWVTMGQDLQMLAGYALSLLSNWRTDEGQIFVTSGPTKAGLEPDTIGGFASYRLHGY
jgi:hypothetical protein